jgi:acyl phosphate:glycerol-3-phosphate acyltransferase
MPNPIIRAALLPGAYLLGSIPWGLVLTRTFTTVDIRRSGSGNIGATNVRRVAGTPLGVLTLIGDLLKGALPVYGAVLFSPAPPGADVYVAGVALAAFAGHLYPVYLRFRDGGKGVATALGCFLVISPVSLLISLLVFIMILCWTGRVSAGSLAAAAALPVAVWESTGSGVLTGCALIVAAGIGIRHRANIRRLLAGTEPSVW